MQTHSHVCIVECVPFELSMPDEVLLCGLLSTAVHMVYLCRSITFCHIIKSTVSPYTILFVLFQANSPSMPPLALVSAAGDVNFWVRRSWPAWFLRYKSIDNTYQANLTGATTAGQDTSTGTSAGSTSANGPVPVSDNYVAVFGQPFSPTAANQLLLANDISSTGGASVVGLASPPPVNAGNLTVRSNGNFTFTPVYGRSGEVSIL